MMKIETEFTNLEVKLGGRLRDDEVCLRIEDADPYGFGDGKLNLIWLNERETEKLIGYLTEAKKRLEIKRQKMKKIIDETNFSSMYAEFERKYNPYPVQMARYEAFGCALKDGLIDQDTYDAAEKVYGKLWSYVGD